MDKIGYFSTLSDSHIDFGSTFEERLEENKFFDSINEYKKYQQHNFSKQIYDFPKDQYNKYVFLQQSRDHFQFPDRKIKSFVELDQEYYSKTQLPDARYDRIAESKYKNVYTMYKLPYQFIQNQNESIEMGKQKQIQYYTSDKPAGPNNENWVTDDSQERQRIGEPPQRDAYRFKIDSSLIDETAKRFGIVFKNYA
jgi:hypothetical protein